MLKRTGLTVLLLCMAIIVFAQKTGTIRGFVYDKASGEPMIFTNVYLQGTKISVQTDVNGYFSMSQVPEGTYTIFTSLVGFDTVTSSVAVKADEIVSKKLFLSQRQQELKGVEVSARKVERQTTINAGVTSITPREMKLLPSAGGEPDVAQYLQVVPGVVFTGDQGGQLYIRGGSPTQTGILLDGVTIYNPFHSIGLYSVFETDAIRNVDVYSAGFNAQYGNRTSAILDVRTKDGNKNRLSGKVSASPIMARAMLEGPITKPKTEGGSNISFLLSAKHSYLDQTSKSIYGGLGEPFKSGLPYSFTDLYGKVTFNGENGSKLNLFGFNFDDKAQVLEPKTDISQGDFSWKAKGGGATFVVTPGSSSALISGKFALSDYNISFFDPNYVPAQGAAGGRTHTSGISSFEGGIDFTYYLPRYSQLKYGVEVSGQHTSLDYFTSVGTQTSLDRRNTSAAAFAMYRKNFGEKFIFEPGFRLQYYSSSSAISPEPRLGLKYNLTSNVRLKFASGIYSQNILSTKSDREIVNFFTGFVLSPDENVRTSSDSSKINTNLQRAYHILGGIEIDVQDVEFNLEPWFKDFYQNIELSRVKYAGTGDNFTAGSGRAYGIDLSARYNKNKWYLWGVISYQKITYQTFILDNNTVTLMPDRTLQANMKQQTYAPPFDRRLNTNLVAAYTTGRNKEWELSARFNYGSAFPFTQTQGFYEQLNLQGVAVNNNVTTQNGSTGILYSNTINGGRLSDYHRLDLSARRRFAVSKTSNIETTVSLSNVYDRNNIFYINRISNVRVYQLPIFPSVNVTWNF